MGKSMKTAISIKQDLLERVDQIAKELRVPRSRVFSIAVEEYLRKKESEDLLRKINEAHVQETQEENEIKKRHKKRHGRALLEGKS